MGPIIFQYGSDVCNEIFNRLGSVDLLTVSKVCKRARSIVVDRIKYIFVPGYTQKALSVNGAVIPNVYTTEINQSGVLTKVIHTQGNIRTIHTLNQVGLLCTTNTKQNNKLTYYAIGNRTDYEWDKIIYIRSTSRKLMVVRIEKFKDVCELYSTKIGLMMSMSPDAVITSHIDMDTTQIFNLWYSYDCTDSNLIQIADLLDSNL